MVYLRFEAGESPVQSRIPLLGWPGIKNYPCRPSGGHATLMLPAEPSDMNSETASPPISGLVELSTIMPLKFDTADQYELLTYRDHIVLPHHTETMDCVRHPSIDDACRIGFARSNPLWQSFEGGTFCSEIETLVLRPEKMESCLGEHQATLCKFLCNFNV